MNPQPPREELEIRITALLMGELPPDEAADLRAQIAADEELTVLHARLRRAAGLLREASATSEQPTPAAPARLSEERRARLLAHFKGETKPGPRIVKPRRDWKWAVPLGLAASLIALIGGAMYVNGFALRKEFYSTAMQRVSDSDGDAWASQPGMVRVAGEKRRESLRSWNLSNAETSKSDHDSYYSHGSVDELQYSAFARAEKGAATGNGKRGNEIASTGFSDSIVNSPPPSLRGALGTGGLYLPPAAPEDVHSSLASGSKSSGSREGESPELFGSFAVSEPYSTGGKVNLPPRPSATSAPTTAYDRAPTPGFAANETKGRKSADVALRGISVGDNVGGLQTSPEATLDLNGANGVVLSSNVSGTAGLAKAGSGTSFIFSENGKMRSTAVTTGTLSVANGVSGTTIPAPAAADNVKISGNTRTKDKAIRRDLALAPDELFKNPIDGSKTTEMTDREPLRKDADSRSPELNLFGRPRTAPWPAPAKKSDEQLPSLAAAEEKPVAMAATPPVSTPPPENVPDLKELADSRIALGEANLRFGISAESDRKASLRDREPESAKPGRPVTTALGTDFDTGIGIIPDRPVAEPGDPKEKLAAANAETSEKRKAEEFAKGLKGEMNGRLEFEAAKKDSALSAFPITPTTPTAVAAEDALRPALALDGLKRNAGAPVTLAPAPGGTVSAASTALGIELKGGTTFNIPIHPAKPISQDAIDQSVEVLRDRVEKSGGALGRGEVTIANQLPNAMAAVDKLEGGDLGELIKTGKVKFWTDDDTTKVNINTAAGVLAPLADAPLPGAPTQNHSFAISNADDSAVIGSGGVIVGGGTKGLSKAGGGKWQLNGANTFTGGTTVSKAAVGPDEFDFQAGIPFNVSKLSLNGGGAVSVVTGTAGNTVNSLTYSGAATTGVRAAGATPQGGQPTSGTTLTFGGATNLNRGTVTVNNGGTLNITGGVSNLGTVTNATVDTTVSGTAVPPGSNTLTVNGTGDSDMSFAGVVTRSGEVAKVEAARKSNLPTEFAAPEIPRITGNTRTNSATKAGDGALILGDSSNNAGVTAGRELSRRISREDAGKKEAAKGQESLKRKDYEAAFSHFKNASENIPADAPATATSRKSAVDGMAKAAVGLAEQRVSEGYYDSAVQTLQEALKRDPNSAEARRLLTSIETPDYFNKQMTPQHRQKVEDVKQAFLEAKGYTDLGRFDLADRKYQEIIERDPYNQAARKGREEVANQKIQTARAGYDATRAVAMWEVEKEWDRPARRFDRKETEAKNDNKKSQAPNPSADNSSEPQQKFVDAFLNVKKGEELERSGDLKAAQVMYREVTEKLEQIQKGSPGWQKELMEFRVKRTAEASERVEKQLREQAAAQAEKASLEKAAAEKAAAEKAASEQVAKEKEAEKLREQEQAAAKLAPNPLVPQPEIATSANAFSTFSLNVSDVAFKLAAASLERGAMPDVSTLRTEEFINAFDYRDPEPAPGAPLAFASERARYPFAQNRDVVRFSVKTAAAGRQPGKPLNVVLLLDNSGSMERADRVRIVREGLRTLSAQLTPQDKLSIVTFSRTPRLWADGVAGDKAAEVTARVAEITPEGGTNLAAALDLGYATALRHYQPGSINHVVMLTDGAANLGDVDPSVLKQKVEAHRKQGIALDCFGVGWEGLNDDMLEQLSRNGDGRYGFINTPEEAATNFAGQLAGALRVAASDVKVQVEWNPKRVTSYRQVGYAKHQLTKEQFRDNTVDAAELAAAESGNALYVVEVNPRGEGDLGTMRVRFKVPGTSDYREHEWAVPFTRAAAPLEESSSSLRLAASAAAFSEMLAGSPFATEVTSDRLLGLLNGVRAIYGKDPRPEKLEWMIRHAKSISGR